MILSKDKPNYTNYVNHQDIRQVFEYFRFSNIRNKTKVSERKMLDCVIVYPIFKSESNFLNDKIKDYEKAWKFWLR